MDTNFKYLRSVVREGLTQVSNKKQKDPLIDIYESLKPSDFDVLMKKYGQEKVINYIKDMEVKKMKKGS